MKVSHSGDLKMRELKYRAWDGGKYIYDLVISLSDGELSWLDMSLKGDEKDAWKSEGLEQFTGLKDFKGVEIYEGDIVSNGTVNPKLATVVYRKCSFELKAIKNFNCIYNNLSCSNLGFKVIGNIHQNKELLA